MPGEEETGVTNALKAITNQELDGKGDKLGVKKGMTAYEKIKAAVNTIKERVSKGDDLDKILQEIAPDLRVKARIKGFLSARTGGQGVSSASRDTPMTPPTTLCSRRSASTRRAPATKRPSATPSSQPRRSSQARKRGRRRRCERKSQSSSRKNGDSKPATSAVWPATHTDAPLGKVTGVTAEDSLVNERALALAHERAGEGQFSTAGGAMLGEGTGAPRRAIDEELKRLLAKQVSLAEERNRLAKEAADKGTACRFRLFCPTSKGGNSVQNSNIDQVVGWLTDFLAEFNFTRKGADQSLRRDLANLVVECIMKRSDDNEAPNRFNSAS